MATELMLAESYATAMRFTDLSSPLKKLVVEGHPSKSYVSSPEVEKEGKSIRFTMREALSSVFCFGAIVEVKDFSSWRESAFHSFIELSSSVSLVSIISVPTKELVDCPIILGTLSDETEDPNPDSLIHFPACLFSSSKFKGNVCLSPFLFDTLELPWKSAPL